VNTNIWSQRDITHILGRDQDELPSNRYPCRFNLTLSQSQKRTHTIMLMVVFRLTSSMKTSLPVRRHSNDHYNSSRARIGEPMASHTDKRKQIWANDFSPPDNVLGSLLELVFVLPGGVTLTRISWLRWSIINLPWNPRCSNKCVKKVFALIVMSLRNRSYVWRRVTVELYKS